MFRKVYWLYSHLGLMAVAAAFIIGFRYDPAAPSRNLAFDLLLYAAFIAIHIVMTMPAVKRALFGHPEGTPAERRVYITVSVVSWLAVYFLHRPIPGFGFTPPLWLAFLGMCALLLSLVAFFEFATFESIGRLVGMPGSEISHTTGSEAPLLMEGPYASVRHPMYRAFLFLAASSLLVHPNAGQLLFAAFVSGSFLAFIPLEERQLLAARGEAYGAYMRQTPYRVLRGIW